MLKTSPSSDASTIAAAAPAAGAGAAESKAAAATSSAQAASALKKKGKTAAELYRDSFSLSYSIPISASEDNVVRSDKAQLARGAFVASSGETKSAGEPL